ncbi:MAG: ATP-binding protein [Cyanobacteria bacterium P01_G01_bin.54]
MSTPTLTERFRTAYQSLTILPLQTQEDWDKYHVPYGQRIVRKLKTVIKNCSEVNNKILFTGHRGCGKSTLLNELARQLGDQYCVVSFSIADSIEMSDVNHITILFSIGVQMMDWAEQNDIKIKNSIRESLYRWFATVTKTDVEEPLKAEFSGGFNLLGWIKGQLKTSAYTRKEIKQTFEPKTSELVNQLNTIATVVEEAADRKVLVIIDDLDKLDLAVVRDVYSDHIKTLFQPAFRIIFTLPVAVLPKIDLRETLRSESSNKLYSMGVAKLYPKPDPIEGRQPPETREPIASTVNTLSEIISRRIPTDLIEPEAQKMIIFNSGGVLRELVRLAQGCCEECLFLIDMEPEREDIKITPKVVKTAIKDMRNDFAAPMSEPFYRILTAVYRTLNEPTENDVDHQKFLNLLHGLYILEYENDDVWYDVHPIVVDLLNRKGRFLPV